MNDRHSLWGCPVEIALSSVGDTDRMVGDDVRSTVQADSRGRATRRQFRVERVAASEPDLILGTWLEESLYNQLAGIAPTLVVKASDATTWQDVQRTNGQATGRAAEAETAIAETEALLAEQGARLVLHLDMPVAVAYEFFGEFPINGDAAPIGRVLHDVGCRSSRPTPPRRGYRFRLAGADEPGSRGVDHRLAEVHRRRPGQPGGQPAVPAAPRGAARRVRAPGT